jgi:hypothetical protein
MVRRQGATGAGVPLPAKKGFDWQLVVKPVGSDLPLR